MKKWVLKAVIQKTISFLPYKHRINHLFQKYVTKGVVLSDQYFLDKLIHFKHHNHFFNKYSANNSSSKTLELGTGWYPVIPLCCFLSGMDSITSVDISSLTDKEKLKTTIDTFIDYDKNGELPKYVTVDKNRWNVLKEIQANFETLSYQKILQKFQLEFLVADARSLAVEDHAFDFILSNNTYEHIYKEILIDILKEFKRVIKPGGTMSHFVDMSDHFAHLDKTITIYNFLQYSEEQWQRIDNSIQPQNRLRINHFREIYQSLNIPLDEEENRPGDLTALKSVAIDKAYQSIKTTDLAISHSYLASYFPV